MKCFHQKKKQNKKYIDYCSRLHDVQWRPPSKNVCNVLPQKSDYMAKNVMKLSILRKGNYSVYQSVLAVIKKNHRLGDLNDRKLIFSQFLRLKIPKSRSCRVWFLVLFLTWRLSLLTVFSHIEERENSLASFLEGAVILSERGQDYPCGLILTLITS